MGASLAQVLLRAGLLTEAEVRLAERRAHEEGTPLVAAVAGELVSEQVLAEAISAAVGAPLVDLAHAAVDLDAVRRLPAEAAVRHLVMPVSLEPAGEVLRAAFSDPLDAGAVRAVERESGCRVEALVATVSDVRAAIDRLYGTVTTRVVRTPMSELPREATRRITRGMPGSPPELDGLGEGELTEGESETPHPTVSTQPVHRIETEASVEQRLDALLLALAENGTLTHADYVRALRRVLGR